MPLQYKKPEYKSFSASCIGVKHIAEKNICQDYSAHYVDDGVIIAAVADGHGGAPHFRSDRGSRFAVETAIKYIQKFVNEQDSFNTPPQTENFDKELSLLEKRIVNDWRGKVDADLKNDTIEDDIFRLLGITTPVFKSSKDRERFFYEMSIGVYGTTLIAAALTEKYWFIVQVGDGKCAVISRDNYIVQPVPPDDQCFMGFTSSLSDRKASRLFRYYHSTELPAAIFLGTDGINNSFPPDNNEKHLAKFYQSVFVNFMAEGFEKGCDQLQGILPKVTQKGSGDDVSVAGIVDIDFYFEKKQEADHESWRNDKCFRKTKSRI
jgi:hypothetical protein